LNHNFDVRTELKPDDWYKKKADKPSELLLKYKQRKYTFKKQVALEREAMEAYEKSMIKTILEESQL
jgi:hypothetical protein